MAVQAFQTAACVFMVIQPQKDLTQNYLHAVWEMEKDINRHIMLSMQLG